MLKTRLDGYARRPRPTGGLGAWQIYSTLSARSCGHGWMSSARWFANTNGFKRPKRPSPTGRRRAGHAPASRSAASLKRGGAVPGGWVLALVSERPGITKAELKQAAGLSSAGVAQKLRRMLGRGEVREEALPGGATGYRIGDDRTAPSASGREGETGR